MRFPYRLGGGVKLWTESFSGHEWCVELCEISKSWLFEKKLLYLWHPRPSCGSSLSWMCVTSASPLNAFAMLTNAQFLSLNECVRIGVWLITATDPQRSCIRLQRTCFGQGSQFWDVLRHIRAYPTRKVCCIAIADACTPYEDDVLFNQSPNPNPQILTLTLILTLTPNLA